MPSPSKLSNPITAPPRLSLWRRTPYALAYLVEQLFQLFAVSHRIFRALIDSPVTLGKMRKTRDAAIAKSANRFRWNGATAFPHYWREQWRAAICRLTFERDLILFVFAATIRIPEHLLAPRIGYLRLRELRSTLYLSRAIHFHKFVNQIQKRRIAGGSKRRADTKRIDRRVFRQQPGNLIFIEIA